MSSVLSTSSGAQTPAGSDAKHWVTGTIVDFIQRTRYADLSSAALSQAKLAILDTIGVTIAGVATPTGQAVCRVAREMGGRPTATVIGGGFQVDPATAALVNGTTGHALDYDDVSWTMIGHPSVLLLPAVLGLAEEKGASGQELLVAYVTGFEVAAKLGLSMNPDHYELGFHATGTLGTIAAAAASAKILGLDEQQTRWTIGIAASSASGIRQNFGTDTKPFHAGNAARAGVLAAKLAAAGFTADSNAMDQRWGFVNVFGKSGQFRPEVFERLGKPWDIVDPGMLLKMYPSCVSTHTSIDATLELCSDHDLHAEDIEFIDVGVVQLSTKMLIHDRPVKGLEGKFSMPYCVARAVLDRSVRLAHFVDAAVMEPKVQALLRRAAMRIEPAVNDTWQRGTPRPAIVTVRMKDGRSYSQRIDNPSGNTGNIELGKVWDKFQDCAQTLGDAKAVEQCRNAVMNLERVGDVREFTRAIAGRRFDTVGIRF
jgi:2-methylcitrate dehydratase PrpD